MRPARFALPAIAIALIATGARAQELTFLPPSLVEGASIDGLNGTESVVVSSDGAHVYTSAPNEDKIGIFDLNEGSGTIVFNSVSALAGIHSVALDGAGQNVYAAAQSPGSIHWFTRNSATGLLSAEGMIATSANVGLATARYAAVSPDGGHVYVTSDGDDALAVFTRMADGSLIHLETHFNNGITNVTGMDDPWRVAVSPDNTQVFVASQTNATVIGVAFDRNPTTGALSNPTEIVPSVGPAQSFAVAVSADGLSVYFGVHGVSNDFGIAVFDRAPMTNILTFANFVNESTIPTTTGLMRVTDLAINPSDNVLLATTSIDDSVISFRRATDGSLTFFDFVENTPSIKLDNATSVAIATSGAHTVVVSKGSDDALVLFAPEPGGVASVSGVLIALGLARKRRQSRSAECRRSLREAH